MSINSLYYRGSFNFANQSDHWKYCGLSKIIVLILNISCEDFCLNLCSWHHLLKQNINFKISKSFPHKCFVHVLLFASDKKFLGNLFVFTNISMRTMEKYTLVFSENYLLKIFSSLRLFNFKGWLPGKLCLYIFYVSPPFMFYLS